MAYPFVLIHGALHFLNVEVSNTMHAYTFYSSLVEIFEKFPTCLRGQSDMIN